MTSGNTVHILLPDTNLTYSQSHPTNISETWWGLCSKFVSVDCLVFVHLLRRRLWFLKLSLLRNATYTKRGFHLRRDASCVSPHRPRDPSIDWFMLDTLAFLRYLVYSQELLRINSSHVGTLTGTWRVKRLSLRAEFCGKMMSSVNALPSVLPGVKFPVFTVTLYDVRTRNSLLSLYGGFVLS